MYVVTDVMKREVVKMGNSDGLASCMISSGTNNIAKFNGGYFSFAHGDEIALVLDGSFYILNCTSDLFEEVQKKVNQKLTKKKLIVYWVEMSKEYEISDWSGDFGDLK